MFSAVKVVLYEPGVDRDRTNGEDLRKPVRINPLGTNLGVAMSRPKPTEPAKKVWRISESAPMGEWVVKAAPVVAKPSTELPEVSYGSWVTSSYDLLDGSEVIEDPDTLPGDLFDELFAPKPGNSKGPGG